MKHRFRWGRLTVILLAALTLCACQSVASDNTVPPGSQTSATTPHTTAPSEIDFSYSTGHPYTLFTYTDDGLEDTLYGQYDWYKPEEYRFDSLYIVKKNQVTCLFDEPVRAFFTTADRILILTESDTLEMVDYSGENRQHLYTAQFGSLTLCRKMCGPIVYLTDGKHIIRLNAATGEAEDLLEYPELDLPLYPLNENSIIFTGPCYGCSLIQCHGVFLYNHVAKYYVPLTQEQIQFFFDILESPSVDP